MNKTFLILALAAAGGATSARAETKETGPTGVVLSTAAPIGDVHFATMTVSQQSPVPRASTASVVSTMLPDADKASVAVSTPSAPVTGR